MRRSIVTFRTADVGERHEIETLLGDTGLPTAGVTPLIASGHVLVAHDPDAGVIGCVAIEPAGEQVLLRSLAVVAGRRGEGLGGHLVDAALATVPPGVEVWALTETATHLLAGHGFRLVDRGAVTGPVTDTELWASACPASAVALRLGAPIGGAP
jgi:amino-acid N-acetyltransferase